MPSAAECAAQGKALNPHTKKCIDPNGAVAKQIAAGTYAVKARVNHKPAYKEKFGVVCKQKCTGGTVCNPESGRCVSRNGPAGKKIVANKNFKINTNSRFDYESNLFGHIFPHHAMKVHGVHKGKCQFGPRNASGKCPPNPKPTAVKYKNGRKVPAQSARNFIGTTSMGMNGTPYLATPYLVQGKTHYRWAKVKA